MLQPIEYNVPLLVAFNKVRFPSYKLDFWCDSDGCVAQFTSMFPTRRHFLQWESACELRYTSEMVSCEESGCSTSAGILYHLVVIVLYISC